MPILATLFRTAVPRKHASGFLHHSKPYFTSTTRLLLQHQNFQIKNKSNQQRHHSSNNGKENEEDKQGNWKRNLVTDVLIKGIAITVVSSLITNRLTVHYEKEKHKEVLDAINEFDKSNLEMAIIRGEKHLVKKLIRLGADVNKKNMQGRAPLHLCAALGDVGIAEILIENGAKIDDVDKWGWTPLMRAVTNRQREMVECLVKYKASVRTGLLLSGNYTVIHIAAYLGLTQIVRVLLSSQDIDVDFIEKKDSNKITAIEYAVDCGYHETAKEIRKKIEALKQKAMGFFAVKEKELNNPLLEAAKTNDLPRATYLLQKGYDPSLTDSNGWTALHFFAHRGNLEAVEKLLDDQYQLDIDTPNNEGETPLHLATESGQMEVVKFLLGVSKSDRKKVADHNKVTKKGETLLVKALNSGRLDLIRWLDEQGKVVVPIARYQHWSPLHRAAAKGDVAMIEFFVSKKIDINVDCDSWTPLFEAILGRRPAEAVACLLSCAKESNVEVVNIQDENGDTPLHHAVRRGNLEVVRLLVDNKADLNIKDFDGLKPIDYAKRYSSFDKDKKVGDYQEIYDYLDKDSHNETFRCVKC